MSEKIQFLTESDELKMIIEFDGYQHYSSSRTIFNDNRKQKIAKERGYATVRILYFVQLKKDAIRHFLGIDQDDYNIYPHGVIDKKCLLPADFCELGIDRFKREMNSLPVSIQRDVIGSLQVKEKELGDRRLVLPPGLDFLMLN